MLICDFPEQWLCECNFPWCFVKTELPHDIKSKLLLLFFGWLFLNIPWISGSKKHFVEYFEYFLLFSVGIVIFKITLKFAKFSQLAAFFLSHRLHALVLFSILEGVYALDFISE